jgi:hypothetical protein
MKSLLVFLTGIIYLYSLQMPAIAGQIWQGKGTIVRGAGEGGSLGLKIEVEGNTVKFLSGPSRNQRGRINSPSSSLNGSIEISNNTWYFKQENGQLAVTLYQQRPYRVVLYRLSK